MRIQRSNHCGGDIEFSCALGLQLVNIGDTDGLPEPFYRTMHLFSGLLFRGRVHVEVKQGEENLCVPVQT